MITIRYTDDRTSEATFFWGLTDKFLLDNPRVVNNKIAKMFANIRKHLRKTGQDDTILDLS